MYFGLMINGIRRFCLKHGSLIGHLLTLGSEATKWAYIRICEGIVQLIN